MTGSSTFKEIEATKILLGDFHTVETLGIGTVRINTHGGTVKVMQNVRYVQEPYLYWNVG